LGGDKPAIPLPETEYCKQEVMMTATNTLNAASPMPQWAADFCKDYTLFLFNWGKGILIVGVLLGVALAVTAVIVALRKRAGDSEDHARFAAPAANVVLDSLKAFIQALSSLPTWLALFGGGVLLLWMAGNVIPEICKPPVKECQPAQKCGPGNQGDSGGQGAGNSTATNSSASKSGG
jgi:hypothetical protein